MSPHLSIAAIVAMLALAGCNPPTPDRSTETSLRIFTWWNKEGEAQALEALEGVYQEAHPNVTFEHILAESGDDAAARLYAVLSSGSNPPDTFNINGGSWLLSHVVSRDDDKVVKLEQLKPLKAELEQKIRDRVWKFVHPLIEYGQQMYGVPLNLHRINNLYYNVEKLRDRLSAPAATVEELEETYLPKTASGFVKLAMKFCDQRHEPSVEIGIGHPFTLETFVFENLMPSVAISSEDPFFRQSDRLEFYQEFWKGTYKPPNEHSRAIIDRTLVLAQQLWPCVKTKTEGPPGTLPTDATWTDSLDALRDDDSPVVFVAMGDWATGYLQSPEDSDPKKAFELGKDFGVVPFPGTEPLFIYTTDTLPLTLYADHRADAEDFLETALSDEAQIAFNKKKGSIPAVKLDDPANSDLQPHQIALIEKLVHTEAGEPLHTAAAISGLLSPDIGENVFREALRHALESTDPVNGRDIMHHAFDNNYWLLSRWAETLRN